MNDNQTHNPCEITGLAEQMLNNFKPHLNNQRAFSQPFVAKRLTRTYIISLAVRSISYCLKKSPFVASLLVLVAASTSETHQH